MQRLQIQQNNKLIHLLALAIFLCSSLTTQAVCYVANEASERELNIIAEGPEITLNTTPDYTENYVLTFDAYRQRKKVPGVWLNGQGPIYPQYYDGSSWHDIDAIDLEFSYTPYTREFPCTATKIRFVTKTGATMKKWYKNVKVAKKEYIRPLTSTVTIDKDAEDTPIYPSQSGTGSFTVNWSCGNTATNLTATITMNDPNKDMAFAFLSPTGENLGTQVSISNVSCNSGTNSFTVYYSEPGDHRAGESWATVTLSDGVQDTTLFLHGITQMRQQGRNWMIDDLVSIGTIFNDLFVSTLSATKGITYTIAPDNLLVEQGGKYVAQAAGEVTITAHVDSDGEYAEVNETKTVTITTDYVQYIEWNQTFRSLKYDPENQKTVLLKAMAVSNFEECETNRTRPITYTSGDPSVVSVSGNTLYINGIGETTLTATQAGGLDADGHTYVAASLTKKVIVHDVDFVCQDYVLETAIDNPYEIFYGTTAEQTVEYKLAGEPDEMTFSLSGEKWPRGWAGTQYSGHIIVDQYVNGSWQEVKNCGKPAENTWTEHTVTLSRNATKVRFRRPKGGTGYHYFKDVLVTRARYIETATEELTFTASLGQSMTLPVRFSYSNVVGSVYVDFEQADAPFSVDNQILETSCGDYEKNALLHITYSPTVEETDAVYTLRITDNQSTATISIHASAAYREFVFNANESDAANRTDWEESDNWVGDTDVPTPSDKVYIETNLVITQAIGVYEMTIREGAIVTIAPTGGLTIGAGGISGANANNLILQTDANGQTGYLAISPDYQGVMPSATIQMCKKAYGAEQSSYIDRKWQYIGCPITNTASGALNDYENTWLVQWENNSADWTYVAYEGNLEHFRGYGMTQRTNRQNSVHEFRGQILQPAVQQIALDFNSSANTQYTSEAGFNLLANSWTAPITISALTSTDFQNAEQTIYLFNTGNTYAGDQYTVVPIGLAALDEQFAAYSVIPAMQGFFVLATGTDASLTLDYSRVVQTSTRNTPMHIRREENNAEEDEFDLQTLHLMVTGNGISDELLIYQNETFTHEFDNGFDGTKILSGTTCPQIMVLDANRQLAISAQPDFEHTRIAFRASELTDTYTLTVAECSAEDLYLMDVVTEERVALTTGANYTFTASALSPELRFIIETAPAPEVETACVEETVSEAYVADNVLFTTNTKPVEVTIYAIDGRQITRATVSASLSLDFLPHGTYLLHLNNQTIKYIR